MMAAKSASSEWDDFKAEKTGKVLVLKPPKSEADPKRPDMADLFFDQCKARRLPVPVRELMFAKIIKRRWKFDFAWHQEKPYPWKLAVEIEGLTMRRGDDGQWIMGGRHASIAGFREDCVKYNTAALLGWTVLRFEQTQVRSEYAIETIIRMLIRLGWKAP
jgi:hypothetical protein